MNDFKFAARLLFKSRGFTFIAVLTLALGIGLNTSMFSLMNDIMLQPLTFPKKDQLMRIYRTTPQADNAGSTSADYLDLKRESADFIQMTAFRPWQFTVSGDDRPAQVLNSIRASWDFFNVLGVKPELGRTFTEDEDRPGNRVIMLSHDTWQSVFKGDASIVGNTVRIDGEPTTVIGVLPDSFSNIFLWGPANAIRPLALTDTEKTSRNDASISIIGRVRGDLTLEQLNARLSTMNTRMAENRPRENANDGLRAVTLQSTMVNTTSKQMLWLLLGLAGFVLLIACGNLANLQLSRALSRAREFAICAALGASRSHLLRPLLAESLLLSLAGGVFGILVAMWTNDWMGKRITNEFITFDLQIDWRVLTFALGVSVVTGLVFGIVPAWLVSKVRVNETLKSGTRGSTGDRSQHFFRNSLVVIQFSAALVLLSGASYFLKGMDAMLNREVGWTPEGMIQGVISPPQSRYDTPEKTYGLYTQLQDRLSALPGAESVSVAWTNPVFGFIAQRNLIVEGREPPPAGHEPQVSINGVTPTWRDTLKIRQLSGRNFTEADNLSAPLVAIINESMATALFPDEDPIGQRIGGLDPENRAWMEIIGVVGDVSAGAGIGQQGSNFMVLRPLAQETWNYVTVTIRSARPEALAEPFRTTIASLDKDLPIQSLGTTTEQIKLGTNGMDLMTDILMGFAALGLFLAAVGLYGVITRIVMQRTPEIGIRLALGAQLRDVVWLVLRSGIVLAAFGTVLGLALSLGLGQVISAIIPAMGQFDLVALGLVSALLFAVAVLASWLPARRATRIDPLEALRED